MSTEIPQSMTSRHRGSRSTTPVHLTAPGPSFGFLSGRIGWDLAGWQVSDWTAPLHDMLSTRPCISLLARRAKASSHLTGGVQHESWKG